MVGVGTDLISVPRVAAAWRRFNRRFLERVYTPAELSYCLRGRSPEVQAQRLAGRFAAKEATMKSLGVGPGRAPWRQVEVIREPGQAPQVRLHGLAAQRARQLGVGRVWVSITHEREWAMAVAIAESSAGSSPRESA
ncbi:MAG: holo-ACP synthase [Limnochordaceae bacterium]|nr:holo-ACP synthase [Limnochordaceae bacterium]